MLVAVFECRGDFGPCKDTSLRSRRFPCPSKTGRCERSVVISPNLFVLGGSNGIRSGPMLHSGYIAELVASFIIGVLISDVDPLSGTRSVRMRAMRKRNHVVAESSEDGAQNGKAAN